MPERPAPRSGVAPSPFPSPSHIQSYLSFDFGTRRVGVATGNSLMRLAQPLKTLSAEGDARFVAIAQLISQWQPSALVVGVPFHPDGAAHDNTRRAQRFARQLHGRFRLPVHEVDERYTTTEALADGAADADAAAAALILEQFLRSVAAADSSSSAAVQDPTHAAA
jgi:putative Holliday junction resolvase